MEQSKLLDHWQARTIEYIVMHATNIDALSIISLLRNGVTVAYGTEFHEEWLRALNNIKAYIKHGALTPIKAFNVVATINDNVNLPEQHNWPKNVETIMETTMNNLQFNSVLSYTAGWPIQFTDEPDALAPGEITGN